MNVFVVSFSSSPSMCASMYYINCEVDDKKNSSRRIKEKKLRRKKQKRNIENDVIATGVEKSAQRLLATI